MLHRKLAQWTRDIAKKLGATGPINPVCIQWGDGSESQERNSKTVNIFVQGNYHGSQQFRLDSVKTERQQEADAAKLAILKWNTVC